MIDRYFAAVLSREEIYGWVTLTAVILTIDLFYRVGMRPRSEPFWSYALPWRIYSHPSAILDYKFVLSRKLMVTFVVAPVLVSSVALGKWASAFLPQWLGPGPQWAAGPLALTIWILGSFLLFDIGHYVAHRILHKSRFFWEFHKVHHAAEVLTPLTALRVHPVETILDSAIHGPLQASGIAVFLYLFGTNETTPVIAGISAVYPLYYLIDNLRHSHLWVSFGWWDRIFSSPALHQIHHSAAPRHIDKNLAQYFSFLDWIGGTLYVPQREEKLEFGLTDGSDAELNSVWKLYWQPVKRAFRVLSVPLLPHPDAAARTEREWQLVPDQAELVERK